MDLVSIILPVYNGEKYIEKCIKSLEKQTYKNIEIIFVDDGSTDKTKDIINNYQNQYKNIKYFYQKNNRQGAARNKGLKHASGKYICFIDSDDFVDKNMVKEMHDYIITKDYDIVLANYYIRKNNSDTLINCYYKPFKDYDNVNPKEYLLSTLSPWNKMYKKDFLVKNNFQFIEKIIYEDYASIPSLVKYNPKIGYIPKAYVYYVHTEDSTMRDEKYRDNYENIFIASNYLYESLKEYKEYKEELEYLLIYHLLYNSSILFNKFNKKENLLNINRFIEERYPTWYNNKYYKEQNLKFRTLCFMFYKNHTKIINTIRKCKKKYEKARKKVK